MTNPADLIAPAREAMRIALDLVRDNSPGQVTLKGDRDVASEVDVRIEDRLRDFLARETPEVGFLGEEHGGSDLAGPTWVLDPIDGTANYVHGVPIFAVSLALVQNDQPLLGLVSMPAIGLHYTASAGGGASCNDHRIRASNVSELREALVSCGDFAVGDRADVRNVQRLGLVELLAATVERVRMIGSAAADLVWVADGRLDASVILSDKPWDVAAGVIIAQEAGAIVSNVGGGSHYLSISGTLAAGPGISSSIRAIVSQREAH